MAYTWSGFWNPPLIRLEYNDQFTFWIINLVDSVNCHSRKLFHVQIAFLYRVSPPFSKPDSAIFIWIFSSTVSTSNVVFLYIYMTSSSQKSCLEKRSVIFHNWNFLKNIFCTISLQERRLFNEWLDWNSYLFVTILKTCFVNCFFFSMCYQTYYF